MTRREYRLGLTISGTLIYVGSIFADNKHRLAQEYTNIYLHRGDSLKVMRRIKSESHGWEVVPLSITRARKIKP